MSNKIVDKTLEQVVKLLPNLTAYGISLISAKLIHKFGYKNKDIKYKNIISTISKTLESVPNNQDTVFSSAMKAGSFYSTINFPEHKDMLEFTSKFIQDNPNTLETNDGLFMSKFFGNILNSGIKYDQRVVASIGRNNPLYVYEYTFPENRKIAIIKTRHSYGEYFYSTFLSNFDHKSLFKDLFKKMNGNVHFSIDQDGSMVFNEIKHDSLVNENLLFDNGFLKTIVEEFKHFKNKSIQRSYLFLGNAGSGKSTLCYQIAKKFSGSCIKLDSSALKNMFDGSIENFVNYAEAKVIVIDDIDRITTDEVSMNKLLYCIESVKAIKSKPILLATANTTKTMPTALLRPGRFDRIIKFDCPNAEERQKIIKTYVKNINKINLELLIKETEGMMLAHLREVCEQVNANFNFDAVINDIKIRKDIEKLNKEG